MKIHCENCKIDLGEITAAKLRKGIVYYCKKCGAVKLTKEKEHDVPEFLKGLFGVKK